MFSSLVLWTEVPETSLEQSQAQKKKIQTKNKKENKKTKTSRVSFYIVEVQNPRKHDITLDQYTPLGRLQLVQLVTSL